jgi:hypothetical protein
VFWRPNPGYHRATLTWAFIWMMFILKIPIAGLLWIVWHAIHTVPDDAIGEAPGGGPGGEGPHPRPRHPRPRRRGAHGVAVPVPPARIRAIGRRLPTVR